MDKTEINIEIYMKKIFPKYVVWFDMDFVTKCNYNRFKLMGNNSIYISNDKKSKRVKLKSISDITK